MTVDGETWLKTALDGGNIQHLFLDETLEAPRVDTAAEMTVLWLRNRPVGHRFNAPSGADSSSSLFDRARVARILDEEKRAVAPALTASVVICTRDRPEELQRCLASLPQQTCPPHEIIVVDNASTDSRTRLVAEAANVRYVREDRPGLDIARNTGALLATSDIVAFTDDDVMLHPDWLGRLVAAFDSPEIGAVTGLVLPGELLTEAQHHFERYWSFGRGYERVDHDAAKFAGAGNDVYPAWEIGAGASMAFRRDMFDKIGLFDERLDVGQAGCSGDSEYWYRVLANGYTCRYEPASVAFHFHRKTVEGLASQLYHYMRGHSAALMVQYERTGIRANLKQALLVTPRWYACRYVKRVLRPLLRKPADATDRFLNEELAGYIAGLYFYATRRRKADA